MTDSKKQLLCWSPDGKTVVPWGQGGLIIDTWYDRLYLDEEWVERSRETGKKWGARNASLRRDRQAGGK